MPMLTERSLECMANEVLQSHTNDNQTLTDGVVKIAQRDNLPPEHIKRLVETVNNKAFLQKFNAATGPDRIEASEFETADAQDALQRLLDAAHDLVQALPSDAETSPCANDLTADLPMTRPEAPAPLPPEVQKTSSATPKIKNVVVANRLRKTAAQLKEQYHQHRFSFQETAEKLATHFTRLKEQNRFEIFEKEAFYKWGENAVPFLTTLRMILKKEPVTYNYAEFRKVARLIDSTAPDMQLFSKMMEHYRELTLSEQGLRKTQNYLEQL